MYVLTVLLVPVCMLLSGWLMYKKCPKKRNFLLGYRTVRSLKSPESWAIANSYCGKLFIKIGVILLVSSAVIAGCLQNHPKADSILDGLILVQLFFLLLPLFFTERLLKNKKS